MYIRALRATLNKNRSLSQFCVSTYQLAYVICLDTCPAEKIHCENSTNSPIIKVPSHIAARELVLPLSEHYLSSLPKPVINTPKRGSVEHSWVLREGLDN